LKVLLVASDKAELKGFDQSYMKIVCGVGPIMAAISSSIAIVESKPDVVFSIGSAGSISDELEVGKAYSFSIVVTPDQNLTAFHIALGSTLDSNRTTFGAIETNDMQSRYTLATSGTFSNVIMPWQEVLKADACDMEAYSVALACKKQGVPFYAVKLITDKVGEKTQIGKIQFNLRDGREMLISKVSSILY